MATNKKSPGLLLRNAGIFNPVLVQAVGLCPVIAMATTFKGAALLAGVATVIITLSELIASMFFKVIPRWVRIGLYIIIGGALISPFMLWFEKADTALFGSLGIYLPIMAVNSLIVLRCERFAVKISPVSALRDGLTASAGYALVLIFTGTVREVLGSGAIGGYIFWERRTFSGLLLPFGGFIIIGFSAAILRAVISVYWPKYLDKKQPKPKDKRKPATKAPRPAVPAAAPDLTPDDSPFSLDDISVLSEEPTEPSADAENASTETAAEIVPQAPAEAVLPVDDTFDELPVETAQEAPLQPEQTKAAPVADSYRDLSLDDVLTDDAPVKTAQSVALTVNDDELAALMSRSTDEILASDNDKKEDTDE